MSLTTSCRSYFLGCATLCVALHGIHGPGAFAYDEKGQPHSYSADGTELVRSSIQWNDDEGNAIKAHAGGMLRNPADGQWYWYGETRKGDQSMPTDGVNCYSAKDLTGPWHFEGEVFTQTSIVEHNAEGPWIIQRPKVLFNERTKKFVMWFHLDQPKVKREELGRALNGYVFRRVGVATADSPRGPFEFHHSFRPNGWPSLDLNLYQDVDGQAYLIRDCAHQFVGITRLSKDYLETDGDIISKLEVCEGMAMFRLPNGTYYLLTSHLTSWEPNAMVAWRTTGTTLDGAQWIKLGNPTRSDTSFNSQPTFVIQYSPIWENREAGDTTNPFLIYMGDNWVRCGANETGLDRLQSACYVWLPIHIPNAKHPELLIDYRKAWHPHRPFVRNVTLFDGAASSQGARAEARDESSPLAPRPIAEDAGLQLQQFGRGADLQVSVRRPPPGPTPWWTPVEIFGRASLLGDRGRAMLRHRSNEARMQRFK